MSERQGDPFGREGEERTDAFGNPLADEPGVEPGHEGHEGHAEPRRESLWLPPQGGRRAPAEQPGPAEPARHGGFLPPTDEPPDRSAWWAEQETARAPQQPGAPGVTNVPVGEAAEWGMRVLAAVVDFSVRLLIVGVFAGLGAALSGGSEDGVVLGLLIGLIVGILVYAPLLLARWNGQTVGHRITETRIVMNDGSRMSGGRGFVREVLVKNILIEGVGQFTFFILPLVNYLWPLWDPRDEALHDKMCNTRVIKATSVA